jgi:endoglucanase
MRKESIAFLKSLLTTPSPSGHESRIQKVWCDYVRPFADEVRTDSYGNAVAVLNPQGKPRVMLDGHCDELGLMVRHIDDKGFIYCQKIGGVDAATLRTKRVEIHTARGVVCGVIGSTAGHLRESGSTEKEPKLHECWIDIGARDGKAARRRVAVGDPVTFVDDAVMLNANVLVGRACDDRVGIWLAAETVRLASAAKPACSIHACSSIQEEVGLHGAAMNVVNVEPDLALVLEVTHATDSPGIDARQHGHITLGGGPALCIGRENHPAIVKRLKDVARARRIPFQTEAFKLTGRTDAHAIWTKLGGVPSAVIGVPDRYMHSTVEMVDLRDLDRAAKLVSAFCASVKPTDRFKVKV